MARPVTDLPASSQQRLGDALALYLDVIRMPALLPELLSDGLVLWRLRRSPEESFWCSVSDREGRLVLTIHSPSNTRLTMSESHTHIRSIIDRADRLQEQFCAAGWVEVDVDFDEPDLP